MLRSLAFVAIAASASAQDEFPQDSILTAQGGTIEARSLNGVNQVRRQEVNSFDVSLAVSTLSTAQASDMSAIREMISTMMGPNSPVTATVTAVAADMTARTMGLMSSATANMGQVQAVTDSLNELTASVDDQFTAAAAAQNAAQNAMTATLTTAANSMAARMADMSASNTRQISTSVAASVSRGTALQASLTRALAGVNSTMIASVASKADEDKHMWLGGCSGSGGCWSDRCLDRVELDTARPKFYKRTNTRMRAIATGFFRMNMWEINSRNWAHLSVYVNGQRKTMTYMHTYYGWWKDTHQDHTHYIPAGQDFWFQTCGGAHGWGSGNSHHRQEYHWVGTRPSSR